MPWWSDLITRLSLRGAMDGWTGRRSRSEGKAGKAGARPPGLLKALRPPQRRPLRMVE
ncbi:hypothetical protein [Azospirillum doebereinerae]